MSEEMTVDIEQKAYEVIDAVLSGFPEFRQSMVEQAIREAEERGRQSVQFPCDWEDLKHLSGEALRDRLKVRADFFNEIQCDLEDMVCMGTDAEDRVLICDLIHTKEQAISIEVERLSAVVSEPVPVWRAGDIYRNTEVCKYCGGKGEIETFHTWVPCTACQEGQVVS